MWRNALHHLRSVLRWRCKACGLLTTVLLEVQKSQGYPSFPNLSPKSLGNSDLLKQKKRVKNDQDLCYLASGQGVPASGENEILSKILNQKTLVFCWRAWSLEYSRQVPGKMVGQRMRGKCQQNFQKQKHPSLQHFNKILKFRHAFLQFSVLCLFLRFLEYRILGYFHHCTRGVCTLRHQKPLTLTQANMATSKVDHRQQWDGY